MLYKSQCISKIYHSKECTEGCLVYMSFFYRKLSLLYMYYNICKYEKFKIWYFYLFIYHILSVSLPFRCVLFIESFYTHYPLSYVDVICRILEIQNVIYIYLIQCKSRTSSTKKKLINFKFVVNWWATIQQKMMILFFYMQLLIEYRHFIHK